MKSILTILPILTFILLSSCKKGSEDPTLSLRSRTNRLTGEWQMLSGKEERNNANGNFINEYKDGLVYTGINPLIRKCTWDFTFKKDGTFISDRKEYLDSVTYKFEKRTGKWNFLGKVGDFKNKEQILITIDHVEEISSFLGITYSMDIQNEGVIWQLIGLSNSRVHLLTEMKGSGDYEKKDYELKCR